MKKKSKKSYPKLPRYPEGGKFSYPTYQKIDDKYYTTNVDMTPQDFSTIDRTGLNKIGLDPRNRDLKELTEADYNRLAPIGSANRMGDYRSPKVPVIPMQLAEKGVPTITTDGAGNKYYKDAKGNFVKPEEYASYRNGGRILPKYYTGGPFDESVYEDPYSNPADPNRKVSTKTSSKETSSKENLNNPMNNPSTGQYMAAGTALAAGGANMYGTYNNPEATTREKSDSFDQTARGTVGAINPVIGGIIGIGDTIGKPIREKAEQTDAQGNLVNEGKARRSAIVGSLFDPGKALSLAMQGKWDIKGDKYIKSIEDDAKAKIAAENPTIDPYQMQQDQFNEKINQMQNPTYGYGGYGVPKGVYAEGGAANAEIEKMEMMRFPNGSTEQANGPSHENGGIPVNIPTGTQIYSDRLKHPETGKTFAKEAGKYKIIEAKNGGTLTPTQKLINDVRQKKLDSIFQAQEQLKQDKVNSYAKKMGVTLGSQDPKVTGGVDITNPSSIQDPEMYAGGGLKRSEDYGSKKHPYPSVDSGDFAGGNRSYPIPTKADAVDALRLAGMHGRSDVRSKVFAKYPSLKHANGGIQQYPTGGYSDASGTYDENGNMVAGPMGEILTFNPIGGSQIATQDNRTITPTTFNDSNIPDQMPNRTKSIESTDYSDEVGLGANIIGQNVGNIYDLAQTRFGKKYDKEDFGRVNPKYLDATESLRDADIQANVSRARLKDLTGGNAGAYLANLSGTQTANTLNKAKIREAIDQANVGIYNVADEKNLSLKNAAKMAEQQNKARSEDIAREAVRGTGTNTSAAIKDYNMGKMDKRSLDIISKAYPDYEYNTKTRNWEHKVTKEKLKVK